MKWYVVAGIAALAGLLGGVLSTSLRDRAGAPRSRTAGPRTEVTDSRTVGALPGAAPQAGMEAPGPATEGQTPEVPTPEEAADAKDLIVRHGAGEVVDRLVREGLALRAAAEVGDRILAWRRELEPLVAVESPELSAAARRVANEVRETAAEFRVPGGETFLLGQIPDVSAWQDE